MLVLVVALVERSGVPGEETGPRALAIVGLLSFAQAGQVSLAIGVGLAELNTTMITGAVVSFCSIPTLYLCNVFTILFRSLRLQTRASSMGRIMRVTAAYSSLSHTSLDVSLVVH
jgi:hypothetical protein